MFILRNAARTQLLLVLLVAVVLNPGLVAGQHVLMVADEKPLTMRDIARMRHDRVPPDKIVEKAEEQGVGFAVTPGSEKQLARLGFTPEQIDAIKQASAPRAKSEDGNAEKAAADRARSRAEVQRCRARPHPRTSHEDHEAQRREPGRRSQRNTSPCGRPATTRPLFWPTSRRSKSSLKASAGSRCSLDWTSGRPISCC